ncbi:lanosterol 14-alpha demethylase [Cokeromyces recurvatus]|uniref:lanosterol 14-alpha demethylase n=1 Tax=Cokeromyces recurvatus TaxID=90255 RepID=UPI00221F9A89|nr:lanosterol 14-alpha demethylase [Cokeromyces recurvatus]KAI7897729.1 lanosterol 14-alpha demethylase [Cokeromyces recurvatus]
MAIISTLASSLPPLSTLVIYTLLAFGLSIIYNILNQLYGKKDPKAPPVVFSWLPFMGNAVEFGVNPIQFLQNCQKKYGDVFTFYMVGRRVTVLLGADGNQFVFNSKQNLSSAAEAYNHMTKYVFGPEVVYDAPHSVFLEQKRFLKTGLNSECFRQHVPMIVEEVKEFFKDFKKPSGVFDVYETFGSLIICTASRCLMGKEIRANLDGSVAKLYYDLDQGFKPINFIFPNLPLPSYRKRDRACKKMAELYSSIIQRRKQENDHGNSDLLQALMDATYKDGQSVPDHHIAGMMIAILFGGQHTSATTTAWALLELAARPDLIRALREEQIQKLGSLQAELTFENLKELTLLENCVRETLRLHPPIFQMMRKVVADKVTFEKTGHDIPKGHYLCAVPGVTQIDPTYYHHPLTFNPMRWVDQDDPVYTLEAGDDAHMDYGFGVVGVSSKNPFLPFGAGRHRCIGEQFGYLQIKTLIATMIRLFDFELEEGKGVPKSDYTSMVVIPEKHSYIKYTWRE